MFTDSELIPISALQHYLFCPRQCALIHIEQQWLENRYTAEGSLMHQRVDKNKHETRPGIRCEFALPLRSAKLGLVGKADVVEFHYAENSQNICEKIVPVEHKRGRPKPTHCDYVQLCAQALCLEEMLETCIPEGAIFYGQPRRRQAVEISANLRAETEHTITELRQMLQTAKTPKATYESKKCGNCSLLNICMPKIRNKASAYIQNLLQDKT